MSAPFQRFHRRLFFPVLDFKDFMVKLVSSYCRRVVFIATFLFEASRLFSTIERTQQLCQRPERVSISIFYFSRYGRLKVRAPFYLPNKGTLKKGPRVSFEFGAIDLHLNQVRPPLSVFRMLRSIRGLVYL